MTLDVLLRDSTFRFLIARGAYRQVRMQQPHEMEGRKKKKVNKKRKELSGSSGVVNKVKVTPLHQASAKKKKTYARSR